MLQSAYYESDLAAFCQASENEVLGELTAQHHFALENQQRHAWQQQISILKASLIGVAAGRIYFEFAIPRMGKRADVVIWDKNPFSIYARAERVYLDGGIAYDRHDARFQPKSDFEIGQGANR